MSLVKRFARNTAGRDLAVGDIHGHFTLLAQALDAVNFNPTVDRLFSVGDLVDRGPECEEVIRWLNYPWFHPVRGNHDDYVVRFDTCEIGNWMQNGGAWFQGFPTVEKQCYQVMFADLPIAIELAAAHGTIGLVHADCPFPSWQELVRELEEPESPKRLKLVKNSCMWSRTRVEFAETHGVEGVRAVICGHTPLDHPLVLGNVYHIDTAGWRPGVGRFTLLDLETLEVVS
ncbi:metallophosphoesterase [uncultured Pseudomonas sp.]|uniref:metallophosphoesterase n=1 Tax=uncultured Pseudomonas sp. TaxID=114707 RepID=UPI0025EE8EF1|nr:metallophosphoesterase [uncultured Pseudomonas sp.]